MIKFNALLNRAVIDIHPEIVQVVGEEHSPDISTVSAGLEHFKVVGGPRLKICHVLDVHAHLQHKL